jgi:glycosyltransferase involved in cell wall biosynthesis
MRDLYAAVAALRRDGESIVLVKTGVNTPERPDLPQLGSALNDLGWVPRSSIPELLGAADILVQPGRPGRYTDYRLPSKLPEFFASGRPVVLPRANVGLEVENKREAMVLERGDAAEIATAVAQLAQDSALRSRIGAAGRAFALRRLRWSRTVDKIEELYRQIG